MVRKKNKIELVTGLDIGSSSIRVAVGKIVVGGSGHSDLQIVGLVKVSSEGIAKGVVSSIEEAVSSITNALEQAERLVGVPIEHAWVGISGPHVTSIKNKGVVAVAKSDGEIEEEDITRAVEAARAVATPLNYEILHVIPRSFAVDGQTGIKDPVGMTGVRLEVDTQIIQGSSSHINNLTKAVYRTGIDIDDLVMSVLATGEAVTTSRQRDLGVGVINIGSSTTSMVVYEEGEILHTVVLPIGSEHVTNDLAIGLKSPIDVAERVKREYGQCVSTGLTKKDVIDLENLGSEFSEEVSLKFVSEIIGARMEEIFEKIDEELTKIDRSRLLPAGIIFTGGGAKIPGIIDLSKDILELPSSLGYPIDISSVSEKSNDLSFSTAVGLVKWGSNLRRGNGKGGGIKIKNIDKVSKQVRAWFGSLVPS
ncbi:MAG: cell division protein FtsA [Candidatus Magasanikbacteria bacterium]